MDNVYLAPKLYFNADAQYKISLKLTLLEHDYYLHQDQWIFQF